MAIAVCILPSCGGVAVTIGGSAIVGDGNLTGNIGAIRTIVILLVRYRDEQIRHGALVFGEQNGNGGLVSIIQQAAGR